MDDKNVNIIMRMILSPQDYERYKKGLMGVDEQISKMKPKIDAATAAYEKQAEKIKEVQAQMNGLREKAEKLQQIGMTIAIPSAAVLAGASAAMSKYVEAKGKEEYISSRILQLRKKQEETEIRIGRVIATSALPFLEKAADLADRLATWAEAHPDIIDAALKIAGAGVVAWSAIGLAGQGMRVADSVGSLMSTTLAGGSAEAAAAAAAGGKAAGSGALAGLSAAALPAAVTVAALAIGGLIGKGLGDAVNKALGQENKDSTFATIFKIGNLGLRKAADALQQTEGAAGSAAKAVLKWQDSTVNWLNGVKDAEKVTAQSAQSEDDLKAAREKELKAQIDLLHAQHALTNAELDYKAAREKAVQAGQDKITKIYQEAAEKTSAITRQGAEERLRIVSDYMAQARQAEAQYEQERANIIRDAGREIQRIEEDSQRRIAQLRKEFENRTRDAVRNRDALGVLQARRDFDEKVQSERETTNTEIKRRREDIALRLADLQKSYVNERKQRNEAMQKALDDQAAKEKAELETARNYYQAQLETARVYQKQILDELDAFWKEQLQILKNNTFTDKSGSKSRASGGYVDAGMYKMHDNEFVMNAATTRAAESAVGGRLTQDNVRQGFQTNNIYLPQGGTLQQVRKMMLDNNTALLNALGGAMLEGAL